MSPQHVYFVLKCLLIAITSANISKEHDVSLSVLFLFPVRPEIEICGQEHSLQRQPQKSKQSNQAYWPHKSARSSFEQSTILHSQVDTSFGTVNESISTDFLTILGRRRHQLLMKEDKKLQAKFKCRRTWNRSTTLVFWAIAIQEKTNHATHHGALCGS